MTREKLLRAAADLFEERGFAGTTTADIAERAGVAEVTLFRHFGSKSTLFTATLDTIQQTLGIDALKDTLDGDLASDVPRIVRRLGTYFHRERRMIRMILFASIADPTLTDRVARGPMAATDLLRTYFAARAREGRLRHHDPTALAESLVGGTFGIVIGFGAFVPGPGAEAAIQRKCDRFAALFLDALLGPDRSGEADSRREP
jgi:AcrR family transcriptional regulator